MWYGKNPDSPVPCVLSTSSAPLLPAIHYRYDFVPLQPTTVYLRRVSPEKKAITHEHVLKSLGDKGRRLTHAQTTAMIRVIQDEALAVIKWGGDQVKIRMMKAAAKVGLQAGGHPVNTFEDIKTSWGEDGSEDNVAKIYAICYADYEGKKNQQWSRELEIEYMAGLNLAYDLTPKLRGKGGYEVCISHAKGNMVRRIMNKSIASHGGLIVLSLKNNKNTDGEPVRQKTAKVHRRVDGEFVFKKNVSNQTEHEQRR